MNRVICMCITTVLLVSVTTGCWDTKPINKRMLPVMMSIDLTEDKQAYRISLRLPDPAKGKVTQTIQAEATTLSEALDRMRTDEQRSIDLLHLTLILISESLAKEGIMELIDFTMRTREIEPKALLAVVEGNLQELMLSKRNLQLEDGTELLDFFNPYAGWTPDVPITYSWEAFRDLHSQTGDIILPRVRKGTDTMLTFTGSVLMRSDRMAGSISTDETLIYNLLKQRYTGGTVQLSNGTAVQIVGASVKHKPAWDGQKPRLDSKLKVTAVVLETSSTAQLTSDQIQDELKGLLEERIKQLFEKLKSRNADILNTGQLFRRKIPPAKLASWRNSLFSELETNVQVDVSIRSYGNLKIEF